LVSLRPIAGCRRHPLGPVKASRTPGWPTFDALSVTNSSLSEELVAGLDGAIAVLLLLNAAVRVEGERRCCDLCARYGIHESPGHHMAIAASQLPRR